MRLTYLLPLLWLTSAWHLEIHNQIGFMAETLISPTTRLMIQSILEAEYGGSLGRAAAWADTVRKTTHPFSYNWHFIGIRDEKCKLAYPADCVAQRAGCVVAAIANETAILEDCVVGWRAGNDVRTPKCSEALKFVAHFLGDVAQPMHTSANGLGGNLVKVLFNGSESTLHQVWDRDILYASVPLPDGATAKSLDPYFASLVQRIKADSFPVPRKDWNVCNMDAVGTTCPEAWAQDSGQFVCDYCYAKFIAGEDLLTGKSQYSKGAFPIIELQISKAAWRLASWLDALVMRAVFANERMAVQSEPFEL